MIDNDETSIHLSSNYHYIIISMRYDIIIK